MVVVCIVISVLGTQRQEDHDFKANLGYLLEILSSKNRRGGMRQRV